MHRPAITVIAAVLEKNELIFAARRKPGKHLAGYWEFPGGKLEEGETPEHCLARELHEELGISVKVGDYLGENTHDYGSKVIHLIAYRAALLGGEFELRDHDRMEWLPAHELPQLKWAPADLPFIALISNKGVDTGLA
jgi:mutator protein MutT